MSNIIVLVCPHTGIFDLRRRRRKLIVSHLKCISYNCVSAREVHDTCTNYEKCEIRFQRRYLQKQTESWDVKLTAVVAESICIHDVVRALAVFDRVFNEICSRTHGTIFGENIPYLFFKVHLKATGPV